MGPRFGPWPMTNPLRCNGYLRKGQAPLKPGAARKPLEYSLASHLESCILTSDFLEL